MTDTTREGFEKWLDSPIGDGGTITPRQHLTNQDQIKAWFGYQAAKADELAFLDWLIDGIDDPATEDIVANRIAELKGKK